MVLTRRSGVLATLVLTLLPLTAASGADPEPGTIVGSDGVVYEAAPPVVQGRHGELFYGPAIDLFCADGDGNFESSMRQLSKLARLIRSSGRRVVFTVAPDKAHVQGENLVRSRLPHGGCDRDGIRAHRRILDTYPDRSHLSVRKLLAQDRRRVYWKSDPHWTTVGGSVYAKALATELDPALGARQRYVKAPRQRWLWPMAAQLGLPPESVPSLRPGGPAKVTERRGTLTGAFDHYVFDHVWSTRPAGLAWPGHTVLLGDSFTFGALVNLRPLFRHGRYLWIGHVDQATIGKAVRNADTVVIEVAQFLMPSSPLTQDWFRRSVRQSLG